MTNLQPVHRKILLLKGLKLWNVPTHLKFFHWNISAVSRFTAWFFVKMWNMAKITKFENTVFPKAVLTFVFIKIHENQVTKRPEIIWERFECFSSHGYHSISIQEKRLKILKLLPEDIVWFDIHMNKLFRMNKTQTIRNFWNHLFDLPFLHRFINCIQKIWHRSAIAVFHLNVNPIGFNPWTWRIFIFYLEKFWKFFFVKLSAMGRHRVDE